MIDRALSKELRFEVENLHLRRILLHHIEFCVSAGLVSLCSRIRAAGSQRLSQHISLNHIVDHVGTLGILSVIRSGSIDGCG